MDSTEEPTPGKVRGCGFTWAVHLLQRFSNHLAAHDAEDNKRNDTGIGIDIRSHKHTAKVAKHGHGQCGRRRMQAAWQSFFPFRHMRFCQQVGQRDRHGIHGKRRA